jgi:hypothetical protein
MDASRMQDVLTLIQMEYLEMPDLKLTLRQARRLFDLPVELCENALRTLVSIGFLMQTRDGSFLRRSDDSPAFDLPAEARSAKEGPLPFPGALTARPFTPLTRPDRG